MNRMRTSAWTSWRFPNRVSPTANGVSHGSWTRCLVCAEIWQSCSCGRVVRVGKLKTKRSTRLKNQGYQFEHNFGHGHQNLSVVLAMLMMLAFLVDQTQQLCCPLFAAAWEECKSKRALWERIREIFHQFQVESMQAIYEAVLSIGKPPVKVLWES